MKLSTLIKRHQLLAYFTLAYGITWGGILALLASKGFRLESFQLADVMLIVLPMLLGPSVSGLLLTATLDGRPGLRELWARMARWRVGLGWWLIALLTVPVLLLAILSGLRVVAAPTFAPGFRPIGLIIGIVAGVCEETGWTGFATPRLLERRTPWMAGLVLGLLWALWHMLADLVGNYRALGLAGWLQWFTIYWLLNLTAYRILMTWLYTKTRSLLVGQLMHASLTGWLFTLTPAAADLGVLWQSIFAACLWALVAAVALVDRGAHCPRAARHSRAHPRRPADHPRGRTDEGDAGLEHLRARDRRDAPGA